MYWDKLETIGTKEETAAGIKRDDITTWNNGNWPSAVYGFTTNWGIS